MKDPNYEAFMQKNQNQGVDERYKSLLNQQPNSKKLYPQLIK